MCAYKYYPKIDIESEKCTDCGKCVDICPRKVLVIKENKVKIRDLLACNLCVDCVGVCPKKPSAIKVEWEKNAFIMNIESTGALPSERIIQEAAKILDNQLKEFMKKLKVEVK